MLSFFISSYCMIFGYIYEILHPMKKPILINGVCDKIRGSLHLIVAVSHGNAHSGIADHGDVIVPVADGGDLVPEKAIALHDFLDPQAFAAALWGDVKSPPVKQ